MIIFDKYIFFIYSIIIYYMEIKMINLISTIKKLKETKRENYFFMRRRIEKGNGKKTLGWILQKDNSITVFENKNFDVLKSIKNQLENESAKTISNI